MPRNIFACMQQGYSGELGITAIGPGAPTQPPASKPIHRLERFNSAVTGAISCLVALSHFSILHENDANSMAS